MKRWGVIGIAALSLAACSKEVPMVQRVILHPNRSIWKSWFIQQLPKGDTVLQGAYKEFYWNGSPAEVTQYKDGVKEGSSQAWYDNGNTKWSKTFARGKRAGTWRLFSADGRAKIEVAFEAGLLHGRVKIWDPNDTGVVREAQYLKGQCVNGACAALDSLRDAPLNAQGAGKRPDADLVHPFLE